MDLHQETGLPAGLPQYPAKEEQAECRIDERAIAGVQPVQRHANPPGKMARAPNRAASSCAHEGSSRQGLVSASAVMQSGAITLAAGGAVRASTRRGSMSSALAEVATAQSRMRPRESNVCGLSGGR